MSPENSPVVYDSYVNYQEAEVDRSAIMQYSPDDEKKTIKNGGQSESAIWDFISVKFVKGYQVILVQVLTFCFILMVRLICIVF